MLALAGCALLAAAPGAIAFQIPTTPSGTWTGSGNNPATKDTPSGLRMTVDISGPGTQVPDRDNTVLLTQNATFAPLLPSAANGVGLEANFAQCQRGFGTSAICNPGTIGELEVRFTDESGVAIPVRNPVLHLSRLGGAVGTTPAALSLQLTTQGIGLVLRPGASNLLVTNDNQIDGDVLATGFGVDCPAAGCGSVAVVGTTSNLVFVLGARRATADGPWGSGSDRFYLSASVDEDFGDAPASYDAATLASHVVTDLVLGAGSTPDTTPGANGGATGTPLLAASPLASPGADADSDDAAPAIPFLSQDLAGREVTVSVPYSGASRAARLCGWIDFDRTGGFAAGERACASVNPGSGVGILTFAAPASIAAGQTVARFRLGYTATQVEAPTGLADSGEVEDVAVTIAPAGAPPVVRLVGTNRVRLAVDADGSRQPSPGDTLEYTVAVANTGNAPASDARLTAAVDRNAILLAEMATSGGTVTEGAQGARRIAVTVPRLDAGRLVTVTFQTRIGRPLRAGVTRIVSQGVISASGLPAVVTDDPATSAAGDPTVVRIIDRTTLRTVVRGPAAVRAGRSVTYRVRVTNTGRFTATGVRVVLALPSGLRPAPGAQGAEVRGRITRTIPTIAVGRSVTLRIPAVAIASRRALSAAVTVTASNAPAIRGRSRSR
jgi:uncharacterized repeat protein (TIGR01451 family)